MHDELRVRVLHRSAHLLEHRQALLDRQPALVAVAVDRPAFDALHYEVRPAVRRAAAIEEPGDRRVRQRRDDLALALEAPRDLPGIEARAQQLQRGGLRELAIV